MHLENTNVCVKYASKDTERNNRIWFSIGDSSGILGPAWERRGTSPLTLLPQYTSLLWVSSMELRKHIVDLKDQQEDSIGGAHRSRLRKAVAAPILTPFGRPGVESPLLVTYFDPILTTIPCQTNFNDHYHMSSSFATHWNWVFTINSNSLSSPTLLQPHFSWFINHFYWPHVCFTDRGYRPWPWVQDRQGSYFLSATKLMSSSFTSCRATWLGPLTLATWLTPLTLVTWHTSRVPLGRSF